MRHSRELVGGHTVGSPPNFPISYYSCGESLNHNTLSHYYDIIRTTLNIFFENITYVTKETPKLVTKILVTKFGFVPDCWRLSHWQPSMLSVMANQSVTCHCCIFGWDLYDNDVTDYHERMIFLWCAVIIVKLTDNIKKTPQRDFFLPFFTQPMINFIITLTTALVLSHVCSCRPAIPGIPGVWMSPVMWGILLYPEGMLIMDRIFINGDTPSFPLSKIKWWISAILQYLHVLMHWRYCILVLRNPNKYGLQKGYSPLDFTKAIIISLICINSFWPKDAYASKLSSMIYQIQMIFFVSDLPQSHHL